MRPRQRTLTADRLKEVLCYDPETGLFIRRVTLSNRAIQGHVAGYTDKRFGYVRICIDYRMYPAHALAYLYVLGEWPEEDIDHINMDRADNRWRNLRKASRSQNMANIRAHRDNTSGVKGVTWDRARGKWVAQIYIKGKKIHLGGFTNIEDAKEAYAAAADRYFGEYARAA
ncbi:MAG: HNH endonuclease [Nitrososphaera sp.]|nr:HNH endonuclease [Nitrososphaera sp.]